MSSTPFRNIALLGATGNLGSKVLTALTSAGFNVTAIQRADSTNKVPSTIKSLKVDLSSQKDLAAAFKGQDVIVSALPNPRLSSDKIWMNAAIDAGVKRIVPSEFSTNLENKTSQKLPIVKDKVEIRKFVEELAESGKIEWTSINNGPFMMKFVWTSGWMGPNPKNKTTKYHDGGEKIVCTSSLQRIAEGVAKILAPEHAASTRNKSIYVYSTAMSEKKMTGIVAKASGVDVSEFKVDEVSIADVVKEAYGALEKGDMSKMMNFYVPFCFGDEYGGDFRDIAWNEKLGLKEMTDGEIEQLVKKWV